MKKSIYTAAVVISAMLLAASSVQAKEMSAPSQQGQGSGKMMQPQDPQSLANKQAEDALKLKNRKEEMLLNINNRMAKMQKAKDCVEAATTHDTLHGCMGGHGGSQRGMMGDGNEHQMGK